MASLVKLKNAKGKTSTIENSDILVNDLIIPSVIGLLIGGAYVVVNGYI